MDHMLAEDPNELQKRIVSSLEMNFGEQAVQHGPWRERRRSWMSHRQSAALGACPPPKQALLMLA